MWRTNPDQSVCSLVRTLLSLCCQIATYPSADDLDFEYGLTPNIQPMYGPMLDMYGPSGIIFQRQMVESPSYHRILIGQSNRICKINLPVPEMVFHVGLIKL